jgi:hypothetical protein
LARAGIVLGLTSNETDNRGASAKSDQLKYKSAMEYLLALVRVNLSQVELVVMSMGCQVQYTYSS